MLTINKNKLRVLEILEKKSLRQVEILRLMSKDRSYVGALSTLLKQFKNNFLVEFKDNEYKLNKSGKFMLDICRKIRREHELNK